jgi:hypothetical protein
MYFQNRMNISVPIKNVWNVSINVSLYLLIFHLSGKGQADDGIITRPIFGLNSLAHEGVITAFSCHAWQVAANAVLGLSGYVAHSLTGFHWKWS